MSAYQTLYGKPPPTILEYSAGPAKDEEVDQLLQDRDALVPGIKFHLQQAQDRMRLNFDKGRKELVFSEGDQVYIRLRPYRQHSILKWSVHILSPQFAGLFSVVRRVGQVAYQVMQKSITCFMCMF